MATRLATVGGYALRPGVSRNGRLYTPEVIQKAVERAQTRISNGGLDISRPVEPMSQRTHHAADDDSTRIVGRLTSMSLTDDGSARFTADIADTAHGRDIAALVSPKTPGDPASVDPFLRGVSIRGFWLGPVRRETGPDGALVETGDDLEIDGLDYTGMPGVPGAEIDHYSTTSPVRGVPREAVYSTESNPGRVAIYESVEARVDPAVEEKGAPALKSGKPAAAPTPGLVRTRILATRMTGRNGIRLIPRRMPRPPGATSTRRKTPSSTRRRNSSGSRAGSRRRWRSSVSRSPASIGWSTRSSS